MITVIPDGFNFDHFSFMGNPTKATTTDAEIEKRRRLVPQLAQPLVLYSQTTRSHQKHI